MRNIGDMKKGFTIPEMIVTIGAIGILAGLTIPTMIHSIRTQTHQRTMNMQRQKIAQGVTMLSVRRPRMGYKSTAAFVKDLSRYMQIVDYCCEDTTYCSKSLEKCWPYPDITLNDEDSTKYSISKATNKKVFKEPVEKQENYATDNVSFVTNNGIAVLINYNTECKPNAGDENQSCYVALVDVNGDKGPNKVGEDLYLINAKGFDKANLDSDEGPDVDPAGVCNAKGYCGSSWDDE